MSVIGHHHDGTIKGLIVFVMKDVREEPLNKMSFSSLFKKVARLGDRNAFLADKLEVITCFRFPVTCFCTYTLLWGKEVIVCPLSFSRVWAFIDQYRKNNLPDSWEPQKKRCFPCDWE